MQKRAWRKKALNIYSQFQTSRTNRASNLCAKKITLVTFGARRVKFWKQVAQAKQAVRVSKNVMLVPFGAWLVISGKQVAPAERASCVKKYHLGAI